jgi:hypothetical protein
MTDATDPTITIHVDDEVLFRLREGAHPLVYPDTITRVSYEIGVDVLHTGAVWAAGYLDDVEVLELDDTTVVAIADIDPDSFVINREASARDADS